jgi:TetR/AcrR family transcriptional repressor of nem operon
MFLAVTAWVMNTDFVYNNASIVWPFCLSLGALDGHPSLGSGLLLGLHGMENVAVADIMKESGFTHGGFYNHFKSKDALAAEAIASAFDGVARDLSEKLASGKHPQESLSSFIAQYLSPTHRDTKSGGCPAPALSGDAARNGKTVQAAFGKGIETYLDIIAAQISGDEQEARQQAIALFSGLVGAMMLSRAVKKVIRHFPTNCSFQHGKF